MIKLLNRTYNPARSFPWDPDDCAHVHTTNFTYAVDCEDCGASWLLPPDFDEAAAEQAEEERNRFFSAYADPDYYINGAHEADRARMAQGRTCDEDWLDPFVPLHKRYSYDTLLSHGDGECGPRCPICEEQEAEAKTWAENDWGWEGYTPDPLVDIEEDWEE